jgi:cellulose biosynthesis protein BcsQ
MAPKQPARLRVVTLASLKGGVGKTTLAGALAVRAAEESRRVALLDLDPQESLASWWTRRGKVKPKAVRSGRHGSTVIDAPITFRQAYMAAVTVGKSGPEVEKNGVARREIDALWSAVKKLVVAEEVV